VNKQQQQQRDVGEQQKQRRRVVEIEHEPQAHGAGMLCVSFILNNDVCLQLK
jgi:hypothetical protein